MGLDPQIQPLVEANRAAAAELPPVWEQTVSQRRAAYLELAALAGPGPDIERVEDLTIAGVPCRLYANPGAEGVLVFVHGGGFVIGDLDTHDEPCRQVAHESESTVIAVDYRRAPEHPFPACVEDVWAVVREVCGNTAEYGSGRVAVCGDSSGGNLAAVAALMARDADLELAAQLLIYPSVHVLDTSPSWSEHGDGLVLTRDIMDWFMMHYAPDPDDWRASPLLADTLAGVAPALVITAEYDPLRDQGIAYAERLRAEGVEVTHANYDGMVHAFFQLGPLVDAAAQAVSQVARTARDAFRRT